MTDSHSYPGNVELLIENLLQASVDYERAEKWDAKYHRQELEDAKKAIREALTPRAPAQGSCGCGIMCQDLGKEAGCRYLKPERETLRRLVDIVYQHATESEAVPATLTADLLIDRAYALSSTSGGTAA